MSCCCHRQHRPRRRLRHCSPGSCSSRLPNRPTSSTLAHRFAAEHVSVSTSKLVSTSIGVKSLRERADIFAPARRDRRERGLSGYFEKSASRDADKTKLRATRLPFRYRITDRVGCIS
ncbi:hypothetical protein PUN28_003527 [Cardiocondyla obscurior]|uniref:Uncharacterized protein n=1 Tax=Cardiocondyla obscurior TaxID=286306 RepID=A0AAW2GNB6_9HYME